MSIPFRVRIPRALFAEMLGHARTELPHECCGFLAGMPDGLVTAVYSLVNEAASPVRYFAQAQSLLAAHQAMRAAGQEHLGIYHSHPTSAPLPSLFDLGDNFYGADIVHFIISLKGQEPEVRGWHLGELEYREAQWEIVEPAPAGNEG